MPIIPKDSENVTGSTVTKQDEPSTILPMEEKEKTFFNPQTGLVDKFKGTKEEYTKDQNVKTIKKYFEPAAKSITDFTQNPDVQDKAMQMMSYLDNTTYEDGQNAADAFVDYTRGREFNLTKSLYETAKTLKGRAKAIIGGDGLIPAISAASILAKVARDKEMSDLAKIYPGYGFEKHAGYPTRAHIEALGALGVSPIHRRSFAPVKKLLENA